MWLPEPIYEILPYLYLVIGVLFLGGAIYIGIGIAGMPYYFALGLFSILGGALIHLRRSIARKQKKAKSE
jgi:membrane protein implicated in regulation of membrane protease activity